MSVAKSELNEYFAEISASLVCERKKKKAFIADLQRDVDAFLMENPEADIVGVRNCFGSPETIAQSFLGSETAVQIRKRLDIKKLILVAIITILVIYLAFVIISLIDVHTEAHGYIEEGIMMVSSVLRGGNI